MAEASILTIKRGDVLVLRGVSFVSDEAFESALHALHLAVGHNQFAVLSIDEDDGTVEVLESVDGLLGFLRDQGIEA
jgi:hypothetical protein